MNFFGLIALFPLSFANYAILRPFFLSDFAPHLLPIVFCSKSLLKEGKKTQKMECKIAQKNKRGCKIAQLAKRRGKSAIEHKDGVQNQKRGKRMGCKIAQKKEGVQNRTIGKR